jgi:hypothetical protein
MSVKARLSAAAARASNATIALPLMSESKDLSLLSLKMTVIENSLAAKNYLLDYTEPAKKHL